MSGVQSQSPNMRFGTSFLDLANHKRAVNDEVLMDKRTGELVYKKNSDGKLVYFANENVLISDFVRQVKSCMSNNRRIYTRPTPTICNFCDSTYFTSYNIETIDFYFDDEDSEKSIISGGILKNPYPEEFSFTQETNGFFVNLKSGPRDRSVISFLSAIYDNHYKNYEGDDEESLKKKAMYSIPGYENSNVVVNYTVTYYDSEGMIYAHDTTNGYVRANEVSLIPFTNSGIYPRTSVSYAKLKINSISAPKVAEGLKLLGSETEQALYETFMDTDDIKFTCCNTSIYTTITDLNFTTPPEENSVPIMSFLWSEFETLMSSIKEGGGSSSGIIVSVDEPDSVDWMDATIWMEIIRNIHGLGDEEMTGAYTDIDSLEKSFGSIEYHDGSLTMNVNDVEDYYVHTNISIGL